MIILFAAAAAAQEERAVRIKAKAESTRGATEPARYYALIIGNSNYRHLPKLKTPGNDAESVAMTLSQHFGFTTKTLLDASRQDTLDAVNDMRKVLAAKDSLLIYYAGHGYFDTVAEKAYWLPVDAELDTTTNWIISDDITSNIKRIAARHILIVSDSCYSGTLTRSAVVRLEDSAERDAYLHKMTERPSRTLMASGGNEPVSDSGGGNNSIFALSFLRALTEFDKDVFSAEELFHGRIKSIVAGKSEQVPQYAELRNSGHEGGDFIFLAREFRKGPEPLAEREAPRPAAVKEPEAPQGILMIQSRPPGARIYLDGVYRGEAPLEMPLAAKKYEVRASKAGHGDAKESVLVRSSERTVITLNPVKQTALIRILGDIGDGKVYLDGMCVGDGTSHIDDILPGGHTIEVKKEGYKPFAATVMVDADRETEVTAVFETAAKASQENLREQSTGMEFVFVKGGCFQMGDTFRDGDAEEKPVHNVCVGDFYLGVHEVSQGQWEAVMGSNPSRFRECGASCPVERVSWNDVQEFVRKLRETTGTAFRLPTEAEWEYAARSGSKNEKWSGTNSEAEVAQYAWFVKNSARKSHPVGQLKPNGLGLFDISGNVWEWCQDWYHEKYYASSPKYNPKGPDSGTARIVRGGAWDNAVRLLRTANRNWFDPGYRYSNIGLRLVIEK